MGVETVEELERSLAERIAGWPGIASTIARSPERSLRPAATQDDPDRTRSGGGSDPEVARGVRVGATLARGGMAVVRDGFQESLARRVAIKTLHDADRGSRAAARKLVAEARVTGALEHPNIVPVHDIAADDEGAPLIVLKHIDGVAWSALLRDPERVRREHGADDLLEWHLRVLVQVCNAVHFAHARGVVHRDLKPDNVMIGGFGEVYVLDWGIALAMGGEGARAEKDAAPASLVGTPWYMAPEMVLPEGELGPWTDVYLLGGILHEIATGRAPHQEDDLRAILRSILESSPALGPEVPDELAAVILRALDPDVEDRFPSALALRVAVEGFLAHRASIELASDGEARARAFEEALESGVDRRRAERLFTESRLAFRQALSAWPENERARAGLSRVVTRMIEHALSRGQPSRAEALLADLAAPSAELSERVARAVGTWNARLERLLSLDRDHDPAAARPQRLALAVAIGLVWTLTPLVGSGSDVGYGASYASLALMPVVMLVVITAIVLAMRRRFLATAFNRRVFAAFVIAQASELALYAGGALAGLAPAHCQTVMPLVSAAICAMLAAAIARGFAPAAAAFAAAFLIGARWPEHRMVAEACANATLTVTAILLWGSRSPVPDA